MRRVLALFLAVLATATIAAGPASRPVDFEVALAIGESATVDGGEVAGVNYTHLAGDDGSYPCGDDPTMMCRTILVELTNPYDEEGDTRRGRERANLDLRLSGQGVGDAAIMVYASDADGTRGTQIGAGDQLGTLADETATVVITTTEDEETVHVLVEVFFHAWVGTWAMDLTFA